MRLQVAAADPEGLTHNSKLFSWTMLSTVPSKKLSNYILLFDSPLLFVALQCPIVESWNWSPYKFMKNKVLNQAFHCALLIWRVRQSQAVFYWQLRARCQWTTVYFIGFTFITDSREAVIPQFTRVFNNKVRQCSPRRRTSATLLFCEETCDKSQEEQGKLRSRDTCTGNNSG